MGGQLRSAPGEMLAGVYTLMPRGRAAVGLRPTRLPPTFPRATGIPAILRKLTSPPGGLAVQWVANCSSGFPTARLHINALGA